MKQTDFEGDFHIPFLHHSWRIRLLLDDILALVSLGCATDHSHDARLHPIMISDDSTYETSTVLLFSDLDR